MRTLSMVGVCTWLYFKQLSRSPVQALVALISPIVQATIATYLFRAGSQPHALLQAAVGAGLMGVWSSVLAGSGGAIQTERLRGTLELFVLSPRRRWVVFLPVTLATAIIGCYSILGTLLWSYLLFGVRLTFLHPLAFLIATVATLFSLGALGILLAATFILMPNANALANTLEYPVWLLSGMLVGISGLPAWCRVIADVLPSTWGATAMRAATSGGAVWWPLAMCVLTAAASLVLGGYAMVRMEYRARVSGTLALA